MQVRAWGGEGLGLGGDRDGGGGGGLRQRGMKASCVLLRSLVTNSTKHHYFQPRKDADKTAPNPGGEQVFGLTERQEKISTSF